WFATDGSAAGTRLLRDIAPGSAGSAPAGESGKDLPMAVAGGKLFFAATDTSGGHGVELWKTDGTPNGTALVKDIRTGLPASSPDDFVAVGNVVYFTADDGTSGRELCKSAGTA